MSAAPASSSASSASSLWGDDEVDPNAHVTRSHEKQGFLDGLSSAKSEGLQSGFDAAFPVGADLGVRVGNLLAKAVGTDVLKEMKTELNIKRVLHKDYFDEDLVCERHELLEGWEKKMN